MTKLDRRLAYIEKVIERVNNGESWDTVLEHYASTQSGRASIRLALRHRGKRLVEVVRYEIRDDDSHTGGDTT